MEFSLMTSTRMSLPRCSKLSTMSLLRASACTSIPMRIRVIEKDLNRESVNTWIRLTSIVLAIRKPASNASYSDSLFEASKLNLRVYVKCPKGLLSTNSAPKLVLLDASWRVYLDEEVCHDLPLDRLPGFEAFGKHLEEKHVTWARFEKKLDKNTTFQACDFHFDAFTKIAQKVKFLIKSVTSQVVETASEFHPNAVRINKRRRQPVL
ncbi:hypothetical protein Tco_0195765 [Tanacetum coccineum]